MEYYKIIISGLLFLPFDLARLGGSKVDRNLGRWTFDEPCISSPAFYENPANGASSYDENLRQYTRIEVRARNISCNRDDLQNEFTLLPLCRVECMKMRT